jgi:hypothetical protein
MSDFAPFTVIAFVMPFHKTLEVRSNKECEGQDAEDAFFYLFLEEDKMPFRMSTKNEAVQSALSAHFVCNMLYKKIKVKDVG